MIWWCPLAGYWLSFLLIILSLVVLVIWLAVVRPMKADSTWVLCFFMVVLIITIILCAYSLQQNRTCSKTEPKMTINQIPVFVINMEHKTDRWDHVTEQLKMQGIDIHDKESKRGAQKWIATNGNASTNEELQAIGISEKLIAKNRGAAGCAASHVRLWRHIVEQGLGWSLVLEDDIVFHPDFARLFEEYWREVPLGTEIVYAGYYNIERYLKPKEAKVFPQGVMCMHAYLVNAEGAKKLLELLPITWDIDMQLMSHYNWNPKSICFNDECLVDLGDRKIRPSDYRRKHKELTFQGLVYQNREDLPSDLRTGQTII